MIMTAIGGWLAISERSAIRTAAVRIAAAAIAAYGIHGSFALGIGSRLMAEVTMQFWNFDEPTVGFFFHVASISRSISAQPFIR